jgi:hypothetical protein
MRDLCHPLDFCGAQAEITIVDPLYYKQAVLSDWLDQKAEPGIDFDLKMVNDSAGESLLQMSPLGIAESTSIDFYYQHVASMRPRAVSRRMPSFKTSRLRLSSAARAEDLRMRQCSPHAPTRC